MSHELDFTRKTAAIAYTGDTPWHGYGTRLIPGAPLEDWLIHAGMDYEVLEQELFSILPLPGYSEFDTNGLLQIPKRKALFRSDTNDFLSIVSDRYQVVQPKEVIEFFRDLINDMGFEMHTAGVLSDGKRVWALAKTGKGFSLNGDQVNGYLLLCTSYDGSFSTTAQFTSIRVVCWNTLSWSLNMAEDARAGVIRIPHTTEFDGDKVKKELGLLGELNESGFDNFRDNVIQLSEYKVSKRQAVEFFLELLDVDEEASGRQLQTTKKLLAFYESGPGSQFASSHNTTWGLVNAVSFLTDHARRGRTDKRFQSAAFGSGAKLKAKAFTKALEMANGSA